MFGPASLATGAATLAALCPALSARAQTTNEADEMFEGHFANMKRLGAEGKLALAGPFDGVDDWRGLFVFAVPDIEEEKKLVATDPVIVKGEMVVEYHKYCGSAALMLVNEAHAKIAKKRFWNPPSALDALTV